MDSPVSWCCFYVGPVGTESVCIEYCDVFRYYGHSTVLPKNSTTK